MPIMCVKCDLQLSLRKNIDTNNMVICKRCGSNQWHYYDSYKDLPRTRLQLQGVKSK